MARFKWNIIGGFLSLCVIGGFGEDGYIFFFYWLLRKAIETSCISLLLGLLIVSPSINYNQCGPWRNNLMS